MANKARHNLLPGHYDPDISVPRHLSKQEFKRRLSELLLAEGWSQSDLARRADIGRDAVSTYVRGRSLPTPTNLKKMADAFGVAPHDMLPNVVEETLDHDQPAFEVRQAAGHPDKVWVRVNRMMTFSQAMAIGKILDDSDDATGEQLARDATERVRREEQGELTLPGE